MLYLDLFADRKHSVRWQVLLNMVGSTNNGTSHMGTVKAAVLNPGQRQALVAQSLNVFPTDKRY